MIIDDVLTSGVSWTACRRWSEELIPRSRTPQKAVREAIDLVKSHPEATLVGILQLVDRQERGGQSELSTVQEIEKEFGVPVVPIIDFADIVRYAESRGDMASQLEAMKAYRQQWGINPAA